MVLFAGTDLCTVIQLEPDEINTPYYYDDREGYFGYLIANVSWPKANCTQLRLFYSDFHNDKLKLFRH